MLDSKGMVTIKLPGDFDFDTIRIVDGDGQFKDYSMRNELEIPELGYLELMKEQPARYAYWSSVYQTVKYQQEQKQHELDKVHAELYQAVYQALVEQKTRPTKDMVESAILLEDSYQKALAAVDAANHLTGQLQYLVKAFDQRKDMLIQFGAEQRQAKQNSRWDN